MDASVIGIALGVMGLTVGWWLLTAGPLGVRRQRRKARLQRRNLFEQESARRTLVIASSKAERQADHTEEA